MGVDPVGALRLAAITMGIAVPVAGTPLAVAEDAGLLAKSTDPTTTLLVETSRALHAVGEERATEDRSLDEVAPAPVWHHEPDPPGTWEVEPDQPGAWEVEPTDAADDADTSGGW